MNDLDRIMTHQGIIMRALAILLEHIGENDTADLLRDSSEVADDYAARNDAQPAALSAQARIQSHR